MRKRISRSKEAELDITSFMNLMIILVPVLLMSMVFSHVSVLELTLPDLASSPSESKEEKKNEVLEVIIEEDALQVNYPAGAPVKRVPKIVNEESGELEHDFKLLSSVLQEVKRMLKTQGIDKKDILVLSQPDTDYQTIIQAMDTVRSYKAVVVASVVEAELFPSISLGDAPPPAPGKAAKQGGAQ